MAMPEPGCQPLPDVRPPQGGRALRLHGGIFFSRTIDRLESLKVGVTTLNQVSNCLFGAGFSGTPALGCDASTEGWPKQLSPLDLGAYRQAGIVARGPHPIRWKLAQTSLRPSLPRCSCALALKARSRR